MRWIFRLLMIVVVLVVGAFGLVFLLPADKIGDLASAQLEKATGRKLTLSGEFKPTIYPVLGVKTGPLTISNADWANEPNMISAQGASVGVGLSALLGGDLEVKRLILDTPVIHLERRADGLTNWDLGGAANSSGTSSNSGGSTNDTSSGAFSLDKGAITNGQLTFTDGATEQYHLIQEINVDFALPKSGAAAVKGASVWNGQVVDVDMSVADLAALTGGQTTDVNGSAEMAGLGASLNGQLRMMDVGLPLMNGSYTFELLEPSIIAEMTRLTIPNELKGANEILSNGTINISETGIVLGGDASMKMNGTPITANFDLKGPENWAETLRVELGLNVASNDAFTFSWSGFVNGTTGNADGTVNFNASSLPNTLALAGQAVGFPKGTGRTARVKGTVRVRDGKNQLKNAVIALDQNTFNGNAELFFDRRPYIAANLTAGSLDFSAFTSDSGSSGGSSSGGSSGSSSGSGWSKDPIRITGLDAINADISLKAKSVNLGVSELGKTDINAKLRNGALALKLNDVRAYQGALAGTVNFSGGNAVKFSSNITANGVQLEPLLGRLLDLNRLTGSGNTTLKMSGTGGSLYQIMHSLSGNGSVRVDKGSFKGIDLAAMMKNLQKAFGGFEGATEFTSLTGTFTMKNGVLQNVDMSLLSPLFKAEGKGQINVGDQNMSYTVTPSSLSEDAKFSVPVKITGPWNNLSFKPELGGLIDLLTKGRLEQEKLNLKAREDELKAKAQAKILEKLNLQKSQDAAAAQQSTEDAIKQSAEDKLKQEVGNALKGLFQ